MEKDCIFANKQHFDEIIKKSVENALFHIFLNFILRNSLLYSGAKLSPRIENFLSKSGRNIQKLGLSLYQNQGKAKTLASMHQ